MIDARPISEYDLPDHALSALSRLNGRILKGSDEVLVSPQFAKESDESILSKVEEILAGVHITEGLRKVELLNRDKFGPRSQSEPWESRKESLRAYFNHELIPANLEDAFISGTEDSVYPRTGLRSLHAQTALKRLHRQSNAGLPYMVRKGEVMEEILRNWEEDVDWRYPCVLFTRTQEQRKTRNVWGYPAAQTLWEMMYFAPFLGVEKDLPHRRALHGPDATDLAIDEILSRQLNAGDKTVAIGVDFSGYDASVGPDYIMRSFGRISNTFQISERDQLREMGFQVCSIPIATPQGVWHGYHGVPSGSTFTLTVDSDNQWFVAGHPSDCQVQGDDGVYLVGARDVDQFYQRFEDAGLTINPGKGWESTTGATMYLQRYYEKDVYRDVYGRAVGVYPLHRAALRLKYLERFTVFDEKDLTGSDYFSLRAIMILENCKGHPAFVPFVKWVQGIDAKALRYDPRAIPSFSKTLESRERAHPNTCLLYTSPSPRDS